MKLIPIQHWQTKNGVPVYFLERHELPMVKISIDFAAGSGQDGENYGISHLTSVMLRQGTKNFSFDQIAECFAAVGARFHATSDRDRATISLLSLTKPKFLNPAWQIFAEILSSPVFPEQVFLRMQKLTLAAIMQQKQMPEAVTKNVFYSSLYQDHPYGHSILGTIQKVSELTIDDLKKFYLEYYTDKNVVITLVGDINRKKTEQLVNELALKLLPGKTAAKLAKAPVITQAVEHRIAFPSKQTHILMGQVGLSYDDPNYFPIIVGNYILGGSPLISRLFKAIRGTHGLAYNIASGITVLGAKGPFAVVMETRNAEALRALKMVRHILARFIIKGPTKAELSIIKKKIINEFPLLLSDNQIILNYLRMISFYNLPSNYLDEYCKNINLVTINQIKTAFQQNFPLNNMVTVMVGDFTYDDESGTT